MTRKRKSATRSKRKLTKQDYQLAAVLMVSSKLFNDYIHLNKCYILEPEAFVEKWTEQHIPGDSRVFKDNVWRCFLSNLVDYRNHEGATK